MRNKFLSFLALRQSKMVEQNSLLIVGGIIVFLLVLFLIPWGKGCKCGESYSSSQNAQFPVNRPKYSVEPTHPMKSPHGGREGFIVPMPSKSQMVGAPNTMNAGTIGPKSNPFMGGLPGEALHGTSVPAMNSSTLTMGNGAGDAGSIQVWRTVI